MIRTATAKKQIEALGFHPVDNDWSEGSIVCVSAEHGDNAADYYGEGLLLLSEEIGKPLPGAGDPWINPQLEAWAEKNGLYWEWVNAGGIAAHRL